MNRRDFLTFGGSTRVERADLSCEDLYCEYIDAQRDGKIAEFLAKLRGRLSNARVVRLLDPKWITHGDFSEELQPVFQEFRARGGVIEFPN